MKNPSSFSSLRNRHPATRLSLPLRSFLAVAGILLAAVSLPGAIQLAEPFADDYQLTDLGPIEGVPMPYGGLTFKLGDPGTLLIGGRANQSGGALYAVPLARDGNNRITGFAGGAREAISAPYNDGGVTHGPGNVLFLARYPQNEIGLVRPGSAVTDKIIDLNAFGILSSPGGLIFVPGGYPGAGKLMLASWPSGRFYSMDVMPDGTGLFNLANVTQETTLPGGPEGFIYVPPGSPQFTDFRSMLVSAYSHGTVDAYEIDDGGVPIVETRRTFVSGLTGAEGAAVDPLTGDFLFSTWGVGVDRVIVVSGFTPPPTVNAGLSMAVDPKNLFTGQTVSLTLTVTNAGPVEATGLLVTHALPPGSVRVSAIPSVGETHITSKVVTWSIPALMPDGKGEMSLDLVPTLPGEWRHEALLTLNEVDPDLSDNTAFVTTRVERLGLALTRAPDEGKLLLSWPVMEGDWVLESTPGLLPPEVWVPLDGVLPVEENGYWQVRIPLPAAKSWYYRLRRTD